ncbi:M23 family metallopeptidase [Sandaracinus amylolyticus]|uniref:M23 family metallopeptidase n=1 Tax=Sandaracinus amylolyticus TaxID=927083 RepID=UPI00069EF503|nr:M23 family metallopeptidase [Sandaracinus amylolyticus]
MLEKIGLIEALGLLPLDRTAREARIALLGDGQTPKSRFDLSSLRQLQPRYSVPLWLGRAPHGRLVPITNLFNHRQPPPELGWSVRVTDVRDFRGGTNSYDSHNGTDFAVPPGTTVVAAAPATVLRISSEFHRGGRKVFLDHGRGLATSYNHLARFLVRPGQRVARGEPIAISGYSGIDALVGFPWTPPHVHFNVWLNGEYVDPFSCEGSTPALWRTGNAPVPSSDHHDHALEPTAWDERVLDAIVAACEHAPTRAELESAPTTIERAGAALMHLNYFPTRFGSRARALRASLYPTHFAREPRLDLPFARRDYDGVHFPDR